MMLTKEQEAALDEVAKSFGWDEQPVEWIGLLLWCAFHYYVKRLGHRPS